MAHYLHHQIFKTNKITKYRLIFIFDIPSTFSVIFFITLKERIELKWCWVHFEFINSIFASCLESKSNIMILRIVFVNKGIADKDKRKSMEKMIINSFLIVQNLNIAWRNWHIENYCQKEKRWDKSSSVVSFLVNPHQRGSLISLKY